MKRLGVACSGFCLLAVVVFLFSSCATIFHGSTDKMDFSSDPAGAKVYVNGQLMGTTPFQLNLQSKHSYTIEFRKEGYDNKSIVVNASVGGGWIVLDVLFGLVPIIVDAATGAWYSLDQDHVNAALERQQGTGAVETPSPSKEDSHLGISTETPKSPTKTYAKLGTGHWVKSVFDTGKMIVLEDGSIWEVNPDDSPISSKWPNATPISVGKTGGSYPYQLIDVSQSKAIRAKYVGQK